MLAWIGALSWLVAREYRPTPGGERLARSEIRLPPTTTFYALLAGSAQVGFRSVTTDTLPNGIRVTSRLDVDLPLPLVPRRLLSTTEALYDQRLRLVSFATTMSGEAGQLTLAGTVGPDSTLTVVISGRGRTRSDTVDFPLPPDALLPDAVSLRLAAGGLLKIGDVATVTVLDPSELMLETWRVTISADSIFVLADSAVIDTVSGRWVPSGLDTIRALRAEWMEHGLPVRTWVDDRGAVIGRMTPLGLTERRGPYEIVNSGYARRRPRNVQAPPLELATPSEAASGGGRIRLGPVDLPLAAPWLVSSSQVVTQGVVETRVGRPAPPARSAPVADSILARYRVPPASMAITAEARRIAGSDTASTDAKVRRLSSWIANSIRAGQPNPGGALETLRNRQGDSSDRALLFSEMARSLGIPARPVAGLLSTGGNLRYRGWAEVWLGEWTPVDPTLAQFPADGGHIRLLIEATARPSTIVPMLGAVRPTLATTTP